MANYTFYVTVSGGKFVIDGVSQQTVDLGHNLTYRFDQSDSSNGAGGTHPLRFSTTSDGTWGGGSALGSGDGVTTNGTPGQSGAYTEIAVTSSTTNPLYYYCSNHSGMGGQANTTSAEFANTTGVALKKPILANATDKWGQFSNQNLDTIAGKLPQSFVFPTGTGNNNQVILSDGSGGTSWGDVALTPEIQAVTWYSDSGYSSTLSASEAINIDDATYLKITGQNFGSSGVFGGNAYVQIINTTQSNAVVGNNQNGLTGCVTSASHQSDAEVRFTINPSGVSGISSGDTLKVKFVTGGGESLFATGYVVSADPTSVTTVNSSTISNTASVGSFGGTVAGGGEDSNTKLLLNFDRTGGTDIEDSSNTGGDGHKITASGNAVIKASPFGDGKSAMFFNGTNDRFEITYSNDFNFGDVSGTSNDFTIELWAYISSYAADASSFGRRLIHTRGGSFTKGWEIRLTPTDSAINVNFKASTADIELSVSNNLTDTWMHLAVVRSGSTYTLYKDGVSVSTVTSSNSLTVTDLPLIAGTLTTSNGFFSGYLDEIRIVKGTAVYTGDFDVPTSRLTAITNTKLLIHSDQVKDSSSNAHNITYVGKAIDTPDTTSRANSGAHANFGSSAMQFGSTSTTNTDYIHLPYESDVDNLGGGNTQSFTVEAQIKFGALTNTYFMGPQNIVGTNNDNRTWVLGISDTGGSFRWLSSTNNATGWTLDQKWSTGGLSTGTWYHVAIVYDASGSDGSLKCYLNGTALSVSGTDNTGLAKSNYAIRSFSSSDYRYAFGSHVGYFFDGLMDEIRITTGLAVYTGNFTVSTSPLTTTWSAGTNITANSTASNVKLLLHGDGAKFTDSSSSNHTITPTGSYHSQGHGGIAPALTFPASLKKTGSAGMFFDGTNAGITTDTLPAISGALTIDMWFYPITVHSTSAPFIYRMTSGDGSLLLSGTQIEFTTFSGQNFTTGANTVNRNQWNHFCYSRNGSGNYQIFINGTRTNNGIDDTSASPNATMAIGWRGSAQNYHHGYIANFRIINSDETASGGSLYNSSATAITLPTQIYGAFKSDTIDTVTLTGSVGSGQSGYVTFNNATLSTDGNNTETTSALPAGLTLNEAESQDNTATITGDLTASAGSHAINLVARVTSDGTDAEIDPNRKQAYSHTITKASGGAPVLFNARRYVGTGVQRDINGYGFQPDLVWIKNRNSTASAKHNLHDSVNGPHYRLNSDSNSALSSADATRLSAFTSDGFSIGTSTSQSHNQGDGDTYIAWAWKAGGVPVSITSGVTNATNVTQSASSATGFSITKFTGHSSGVEFPHNLGGTPEFIIVKDLDDSNRSWVVYHKDLSASNKYLVLSSSASEGTISGGFGTQTSTDIVLGTDGSWSGSSNSYICYAWKAVSGVSAFGSYTVSGSSGHTVSSLSFKPRFVMIKRTDGTNSWAIFDSFREATDLKSNYLLPDSSGAEASYSGVTVTFTNTGFTTGSHNTVGSDGSSYIYMAFA